jgi:hypothetical protein
LQPGLSALSALWERGECKGAIYKAVGTILNAAFWQVLVGLIEKRRSGMLRLFLIV